MKRCLSCNQIVPDDSIFCPYCGSNQIETMDKTVKYCQDCGKKIAIDSQKCSFCGSENIAVFKNGIDIPSSIDNVSEFKQNELERQLRSKDTTIEAKNEIIANNNKRIRNLQLLALALALAFIIAVGVGIHNYNNLMADYNCEFGYQEYCE